MYGIFIFLINNVSGGNGISLLSILQVHQIHYAYPLFHILKVQYFISSFAFHQRVSIDK